MKYLELVRGIILIIILYIYFAANRLIIYTKLRIYDMVQLEWES